MSMEMRNTLLYGQLHEGLRYNLLKSPAVSGAIGYIQLCVAARTEERRQNELSRRQHYQQEGGLKREKPRRQSTLPQDTQARAKADIATPTAPNSRSGGGQGRQPRCWNCNCAGHIARDCLVPKQESTGSERHALPANAKAIRSEDPNNPLSLLI